MSVQMVCSDMGCLSWRVKAALDGILLPVNVQSEVRYAALPPRDNCCSALPSKRLIGVWIPYDVRPCACVYVCMCLGDGNTAGGARRGLSQEAPDRVSGQRPHIAYATVRPHRRLWNRNRQVELPHPRGSPRRDMRTAPKPLENLFQKRTTSVGKFAYSSRSCCCMLRCL